MTTNFNKIVKEKERDIDREHKERLSRCIPIAQKILEMIAEEKLPMGDLADKQGKIKDDVKNRYDDFTGKVLVYMLQSGLKYSEKKFVFQLLLQQIEQTQEKVLRAIGLSFERAFEEKWKDELDITLGDIHEILLAIANKK
jgi:hypothetical protein